MIDENVYPQTLFLKDQAIPKCWYIFNKTKEREDYFELQKEYNYKALTKDEIVEIIKEEPKEETN